MSRPLFASVSSEIAVESAVLRTVIPMPRLACRNLVYRMQVTCEANPVLVHAGQSLKPYLSLGRPSCLLYKPHFVGLK